MLKKKTLVRKFGIEIVTRDYHIEKNRMNHQIPKWILSDGLLEAG